MKKLIICASVLALAACGGGEAEPEAMEDKDAMAEEEAMEEESSAVIPGDYTLVYEDGTEGVLTIGDDGTYSGTAGDQSISGTVEEVDGKACFDPEGDAPGMCWTADEPGEDGSFNSTADDGGTVTVTPVAAE